MNEQLETLREIRSLMERSTKFLSLSGLSGIAAGVFALAGALMGYRAMLVDGVYTPTLANFENKMSQLLTIAGITLALAIASATYFTLRKANKNKQNIWNDASKDLMTNFSLPMLTGGIFCIGLVYHDAFEMCFSAMLIFYGLALINAAKFTVRDVFYLGVSEVILGLIVLFMQKYNFIFWSIGFGVLHIVYGTLMYYKYARESN
jgi:hypothetical protein